MAITGDCWALSLLSTLLVGYVLNSDFEFTSFAIIIGYMS